MNSRGVHFRAAQDEDTGFRPRRASVRIAPTETRRAMRGSRRPWKEAAGPKRSGCCAARFRTRQRIAWRRAGHAGLFSTADDLAIFCQMILNGGEYGGARILSPLGVATMTRPRAVTDDGAARGLAGTSPAAFGQSRRSLPARLVGHTGFTGTSMWIDRRAKRCAVPERRLHRKAKAL